MRACGSAGGGRHERRQAMPLDRRSDDPADQIRIIDADQTREQHQVAGGG